MTIAAPTFSQIKAQVAAIRQKVPNARVIGIHAPGRWSGEKLKRDGDESYLIQQCDSPLAMRLALREPAEPDATRVLITSLDNDQLSDDIRLRLSKRKLFPIDSWQIVRSLFQARTVDPRLSRPSWSWIADALLELFPAGGYPPARGGFLDAETVWPLLLGRVMGLSADNPDLASVLRWSIDADAVGRFRHASDAFRAGAIEWLSERTGPVAGTILRCVQRLERPDALALGLAAGVVFHPMAAGRLEKAAGKLEERFLGGENHEPAMMGRWAATATEVVRLQLTDPKLRQQQVQRADEILSELQGEAFAYLSDTSPLGFDQRLAQFGQRLSETLQAKSYGSLDGLQEARETIRRHDKAGREARRLERVDMTLRLVSWLASRQTASPPPSLATDAADHLRDGGYVDWARLALRAGDAVPELSQGYARLFDEVTSIREQQAAHFGRLLREWTAAGSTGDDVIPMERILEQVVAPLAAKTPVLLIVIDGMSVAVCRELLADATREEWIALTEPGRPFNRPGIATIPSVTEMSRTSLMCGQLRRGSSSDEKIGFAEHPTLLEQCRNGYPPVLFHKASLTEFDDASLAAEVRHEIGSTHRKIVGIVVNAVDDHLLKGEQIDTRWSRDEIKVLPALLHEARLARRVVVLVSDHGHVLDCQTIGRIYDGGERWRPDNGQCESNELQVQGSRVLTDGQRLIAPWTEKLRYGIKKNGYHGGLTPQEMVVPIVVLSSSQSFPAGWTEASVDSPDWWDAPLRVTKSIEPTTPKLKPATLFDLIDQQEEQAPAEPPQPSTDDAAPPWVSRLVSAPVFAAQKQLGGRAVPADEVFTRLLSLLDRRGGKMTSVALARALDYPPLRLRGLLAVAQRVLNVDGYAVISRDEASDTVELNRDLLLVQFDLV
ncbi:MAG: BREX-2 system phosphatase PglZ [Planctomycetes bacterium]|nr:BREX-2 system phosphatase PglZ [Planctomycetota bacterium]